MSALGRRTTVQTTRAEAHRRAMLNATLSLLQDGTPYLELTVQQIAVTAGVSRPTFYAHFSDRRELLIELMKDALAPMFAGLVEEAPASGSALGPSRIRPFIALALETFRAAGPLFCAAVEASSYDAVVRARMLDAAEPFIAAASVTIAAQQQAGRALPGDPRMTASILVWAVVDSGHRQIRDQLDASDPTLIDTLADLALRMVYGNERPAADPAAVRQPIEADDVSASM